MPYANKRSKISILERGHSFSTYAKFFEKLTFLRTGTYQGVRNVSFSENFAQVLNGISIRYSFGTVTIRTSQDIWMLQTNLNLYIKGLNGPKY